MAITSLDAKTIDELQELGKLNGSEKLIVSVNEEDTRKIAIDTLVGYAAALLSGLSPSAIEATLGSGQCITFIKSGEEIPINRRIPGCFYLEEQKQSSIRTQINLPTSVKVSSTLGLRRV